MKPPFIKRAAEPRELISITIDWLKRGHRVALLTLENIEGNAPYPVGSQMLVREDGEYVGQITGGCAEKSLAEQSRLVIQAGDDITERYGLNSRYFDIQLPCGSGVDIQFDVTTTLVEYQAIADQLGRRQAVKFSDSKTYFPNEQLLLCGQGPIMASLSSMAQQAGFDVLVFEHNDTPKIIDYCDSYTALVSLFHEHDLEIDIFKQTLSTDLFYIGALGSRQTHAKRLQNLQKAGVDRSLLDKIHGPVGADIGAVTPAQIAISILSELVSVMNKDGRFTA